MEILLNFILTILGMLIHIVWKTREHINNGFKWKILWDENKYIFLWSVIFMILVSVTTGISPESAEAIGTLSGFDFGKNASYVTIGILLVSTTKEVIKTRRKRKHNETDPGKV